MGARFRLVRADEHLILSDAVEQSLLNLFVTALKTPEAIRYDSTRLQTLQ